MHEANAIVIYSPTLVAHIPRSFAAPGIGSARLVLCGHTWSVDLRAVVYDWNRAAQQAQTNGSALRFALEPYDAADPARPLCRRLASMNSSVTGQ